MDSLLDTINALSGFVWGPYLLIPLLVGAGAYFLIGLKFMPIWYLGPALKQMWASRKHEGEEGELTPFQALMTSLAGTIGTGNIVGVATAIYLGGPGAVFWMWITAIVGMATKYCEATLAVKYREVAPDGSYVGGPMYYIRNGLGEKWAPLAIFFALAATVASFGIGNMTQANAITANVVSAFSMEPITMGSTVISPSYLIAGLLFVVAAAVLLGGVKRIGAVAGTLVPFMAIIYILVGLVVVIMHIDKVPAAFGIIFGHAFTPIGAVGGFTGSVVARTIQMGVARGLFSNEAGLGSAPIAHATTTETNPVKQGFLGMVDPFIDTLCICTITALVIVISGEWMATAPADISASEASAYLQGTLTARAFDTALPGVGQYIVAFGLTLFAFTTILGWSVYGERSARFLFGHGASTPYRVLFVLAIPIGAVVQLDLVWAFADLANGLMALPNLVGLLFLSPVVFKLTREYFDEEKKKKEAEKANQ